MLKPNPRPKLFGLAVAMMIGVVIPDGAAADSEKSALEKQIIDEVVLTVNAYLDRGVPVSHDSEASAGYWQARGVGSKISSKYQKLKPQKALAVCIAWEASHLGGIVVRSFGGSMRSAHLSSAIETAIFHCEKSRARGGITDCECAVLAENDKLILGVPESFLSRAKIPRAEKSSIDDINAVPCRSLKCEDGYRDFLNIITNNKAFAISPYGAWAYKPNRSWLIGRVAQDALERCQKHANDVCDLYAVGDKVVWQGP